MKKFQSLKKSHDFDEVYRQGRSYGNRLLVMYILEKGRDHEARVGVSVSKRTGNSVVRHRIKRLVKENFRTTAECWSDGYDYVVIARKEAGGRDFREIGSALVHLGKRLKVYSENNPVSMPENRSENESENRPESEFRKG